MSDSFIDPAKLIVRQTQNTATEIAALVLPTVGSNRERHPKLQRFMLANDSVTVAVEVPVWLSAEEVRALQARCGICLSRGIECNNPVTGHIDFMQVRNGLVHILDYKPDAGTNRPVAQLTLYALALSYRTGIPLFDFKCAWFNEREYCEFFPRSVLAASTAPAPALGGIEVFLPSRRSRLLGSPPLTLRCIRIRAPQGAIDAQHTQPRLPSRRSASAEISACRRDSACL